MDEHFSPWPVVCAIDFGTTYSGYAYSMRPDYERHPLNIESYQWHSKEMTTLKTPTTILFDKAGNFHSFGYEAEKKYAELAERAQEEDGDESVDSDDENDEAKIAEWLYFRRFKMKLYRNYLMQKRKLKFLKLSAENGKKLLAFKVFSEAIKFLKNHFEGLLKKSTVTEHDGHSNRFYSSAENAESSESPWSDDILWVLTVPAIWSDQAKQFMREAAIQAGIKDNNLVLALEPESAALLCKQLALIKRTDDISVRTFKPGNKFMVVDCGGGTVDVTSYCVEDGQSLRELHCASGKNVGGTNVDDLFFELLNDIFGEKIVNEFKNNSPSDWLEMWRGFEVNKRNIGHNNPDELITFSHFNMLFEKFKKANKSRENSVKIRLQEMELSNKIKCKDPKLRIKESYFTDTVFAGPIKDIVKHLKNLFTEKEVEDIDIILLVGGFSECPMLQKEIQMEFPNKAIVNPREGSTAVMKGAVLFGHSAEIIARKRIEQGHQLDNFSEFPNCVVRRSGGYYGVAADLPFVDGEHPLVCKYTNEEGKTICSGIFDCLIKRNQELEIGKTSIEKTFRSFNSSLISVEIYHSNREVQYCHEEGCEKIGHILVRVSDDSRDKRLFKFKLHFGFTEIIATAIDLKTHELWKAKLDFLS
ncbi:heat shock 70 kDa protein 12A-like [Crassostrea angulata]|uniref:heat shock 70 kDa protein 12A-like n=1 Tax=Magallana angulata TaxID=2784310 RepID=UPI0022B1AF7B|nr:heat shock 70 kDa protein 12A-like [Crassostrea angulata]